MIDDLQNQVMNQVMKWPKQPSEGWPSSFTKELMQWMWSRESDASKIKDGCLIRRHWYHHGLHHLGVHHPDVQQSPGGGCWQGGQTKQATIPVDSPRPTHWKARWVGYHKSSSIIMVLIMMMMIIIIICIKMAASKENAMCKPSLAIDKAANQTVINFWQHWNKWHQPV